MPTGTTSRNAGHTHGFKTDARGSGRTTSTSSGPPHTHQIVNNVVRSAKGKTVHGHGRV